MLLVFLLAAILVASNARDVDDFYESFTGVPSHTKYEFIYHDNYNLLLTINTDNCFYTSVTESSEYLLITRYRQATETYLSYLIHNNRDTRAHHTTLEAVSQNYGDILADFHCRGKNIYTMTLSNDDIYRITNFH